MSVYLKVLVLLSVNGFMLRAQDVIYLVDLGSSNGYQWRAFLPNGSMVVEAQVPGGVYTDLQRAGYLNEGPFLYRFNDHNYRWVSYNDWVYELHFDVNPKILGASAQFLVFEGIDTVADVTLNGQTIGQTDNMFVRYRFNVQGILKSAGNELQVRFESPVRYARERYEEQLIDYEVPPRCVPPEYQGECHANHIRKMQASFSWDWGPAFPSLGLWKKVTLEAYETLTLRDIYVETVRKSDNDGNSDLWQLALRVQCETADVGAEHIGTWQIELINDQGLLVQQLINDQTPVVGDLNKEGSVHFQLDVAADQIQQWMPNGYGKQTLYTVRVNYVEYIKNNLMGVTKEVKIGFRTVALIEDDLETGGRTFYVTVNDVPVFLKGSNWIPADVLPELVTPEYIRMLLTSCKDANMNSLRVWGGGIYELDEFYQVADELGILIWQDFMFACSMYPVKSWFLDTVSIEVRQQVRRLQHHPSLLLWAGSNENEAALRGNWYGTIANFNLYREDYIKLYVDTIRSIVEEEDPSRPFVVSSPSNGKLSEEEGYIAKDPYSQLHGDVHYYNYYANAWNWTSYPKPRMATEYGFQALPSIHAWAEAAGTYSADEWMWNGTLLADRQHHPLGNTEMLLQVESRLGKPRKHSPLQEFLDMIYLTQMHQAQAIKVQTEHYRRFRYQIASDGSGLTMAALYWQLNDIWQAPSWASIEYGGRWKPLHYFAVRFFAPLAVFLVELEDGSVAAFVHFDRREDASSGILKIAVNSWDRLDPLVHFEVPISQNITTGVPAWSTQLSSLFNQTGCSRETCVISGTLVNSDSGLPITPSNELYLSSFPYVTNLQKADIQVVKVSKVYASSRSQWTVNVTLATDQIAAFVWIDTITEDRGTFSNNGFLFKDHFMTLFYYSQSEIKDISKFRDSLTVVHLGQIIQ